MRQLERYIERNWLFILAGLWLATKAIDVAYRSRGYKAAGSELLVLPVFLFAVEVIRYLINIYSGRR